DIEAGGCSEQRHGFLDGSGGNVEASWSHALGALECQPERTAAIRGRRRGYDLLTTHRRVSYKSTGSKPAVHDWPGVGRFDWCALRLCYGHTPPCIDGPARVT